MTEDEYDLFLLRERITARAHLDGLLYAWRRQLWPSTWWPDPIEQEDQHRADRVRRQLLNDLRFGMAVMRPESFVTHITV